MMKELIKISRTDEQHTEVIFDLDGMSDAEALVEGLCAIFRSRPETIDIFKAVILFYEEMTKEGITGKVKPQNKIAS